jgi:hypothetical protein
VEAVILIEEHDPWHIRQIITRTGHVLDRYFYIDPIFARHGGGIWWTGGNNKYIDQGITFIGVGLPVLPLLE